MTMLGLEIEFLTGRYVATAYNDRNRCEWPPHPARVFSALVAVHMEVETPDQDERRALEWLENQAAPSIAVGDADPREVTTVFVPVNDPVGVKALPELRTRQPRTFPSCTPRSPKVAMVWTLAEPSPAVRCSLDRLATRLVRLGHSSSLVRVRWTDVPPEPAWVPDPDGDNSLRVAGPGQTARLLERFELHHGLQPRVMPFLAQRYRRVDQSAPREIPSSVFSGEWLTFRRIDGPRLPSSRAVDVARAFRAALMSYVGEPVPSVLSGHEPDGLRTERPHAAFVPLPFVGSDHADGAILGIAIVLPVNLEEHARHSVFRAVGAWEQTCRQEDEECPRLELRLGAAGVLGLERVDTDAVLRTLRDSTWSGPSRRWTSITPVALDRTPGHLRSRDAAGAAKAADAAVTSIGDSCERIGLPRPLAVQLHYSVPLVGGAKAATFAPFPAEPDRVRRVLTHASLTFEEAVRGPVILGAGRHVGLGLFRPVEEEA